METEAIQAPWKKVLWYLVLTALSIIVLFPVYMTLVRALSTPAVYAREGQPMYPVAVQWDVFQRAFQVGDLGPKLLTSWAPTMMAVATRS